MSQHVNPVGRLLFFFFVFMTAVSQAGAEEWRGLTPLRSTRADVVRVFGQCANEEQYCYFNIKNEEILIVFSKPQDCAIARDTVLSIQRELEVGTTFTALGLDTRRFKSFDPSWPRGMGYRGYIDEKNGLLLKTFGGEIFQIIYIAGKKGWPVCQSYYRRPREFVDVIFPHVLVISSVGCPETSIVAGEKVVIKANYARTGQRMLLTWHTTGGRILEGENTSKILLDTTGVEEKAITVTVELNDGSQHTATGSCTFKISPQIRN